MSSGRAQTSGHSGLDFTKTLDGEERGGMVKPGKQEARGCSPGWGTQWELCDRARERKYDGEGGCVGLGSLLTPEAPPDPSGEPCPTH